MSRSVFVCALAMGAAVGGGGSAALAASEPTAAARAVFPRAAAAQDERAGPVKPVATPLPTISIVWPREVVVGGVLTLRGHNFRPGRLRNQVVFIRPGQAPVFALAAASRTRTLKVRVPAKLLPAFTQRDGRPVPTRFRVSVLTDRLQPAFTPTDASPLIYPPSASLRVVGTVDCNGDGVAESPRRAVLGLAVVGLGLYGVLHPDPQDTVAVQLARLRDRARRLPAAAYVPGTPGLVDAELPLRWLPVRSLVMMPPQPDCAAAPTG